MKDREHSTTAHSRQRIGSVLVLLGLAIAASWWWLTRPTRAELEQAVYDAFARNDFVQAEASLLQISPRDADVLKLLADVSFKTDKKQDGIRWMEQLAELSTDPPTSLLATGARAFELGLPRDAERLYLRALELMPKSLKPYSQLARLYLAWQRELELRQIIEKADAADLPLSDDPMLLWLWIIGDRVHWLEEDSHQWLELAHREQPDDPFVTAALVRYWLESKQLDRAREMIAHVPKTSSPRWPIALAQAAIDLDSGDLAGTLTALDSIEGTGDDRAAVWFLRGEVWLECNDKDGALLAFANATQLDPWFVGALHERGRLLTQSGNREAERLLHEATLTDDLARRCMQLAQSTQPNLDDLLAVASLGTDLGAVRWTQLVCRLIEKQHAEITWPPRVQALRSLNSAKLSLENPAHLNRALAKRRVVAPRPASKSRDDSTQRAALTIQFKETTRELGLHFVYEFGHSPQRWLMETLGGGVAVLDYDADGWPDLFFAQGGSLKLNSEPKASPCQFNRNRNGESLHDVTEASFGVIDHYSHGCAVGDVNGDGFADLLACHYGGLTLLINQGDGTWYDATEASGLKNDRWNTSAAFVDLDQDGDLDLYVARYCRASLTNDLRVCHAGDRSEPCRPNAYPAEPDAVFENLGDGHFSDRSTEWGITAEGGYGLGVIAADFDDDGRPEVFVGNDTTHNFLWRSSKEKNKTFAFEERSLITGVAVDGTGRAEASMGIACGDVNGDQKLDLFVTTFFDETPTLFQNLSELQFEDRTRQVGLSNAGLHLMGWGCQLFDADNDGWLDLAILNGHLHDRPQRPQFYRNQLGHFVEQSAHVGAYFAEPKLGRSVATWDYNRDGRVDLVMSHQTEPAAVLRNDAQAGRSLVVKLIGTQSPRDATGAVVRARVGNQWLLRLVSTQGGYLSACSTNVALGLGNADVVDELEIRWPSGLKQHFTNVAASRELVIIESQTPIVGQAFLPANSGQQID